MKKIILFIILAACLIVGGLLLYEEWEARQPPKILLSGTEGIPAPEVNPKPDTSIFVPDIFDDEMEAEIPSPDMDDQSTHKPTTDDFGMVTIKGKTFPVKRGVSEKALAGNIGWMESSAMAGQDGMCVLMGHRNQQFRILKDVRAGDEIIFTYPNGQSHAYTVQSAKIVENDKTLRFEASEGKTLLLITCYPFYYRGHAPQKFVILCQN